MMPLMYGDLSKGSKFDTICRKTLFKRRIEKEGRDGGGMLRKMIKMFNFLDE